MNTGGDPRSTLADRLGRRLQERGLTIAVAESLTGGQLSAALAAAPDAGEWFRGGLVSYASEVKFDLLGVDRGPVITCAAAEQMAVGAARLLGADAAVAITGVGGPEPVEGQEPGTVHIAWFGPSGVVSATRHHPGDPDDVVRASVTAALQHAVDGLTTSRSR